MGGEGGGKNNHSVCDLLGLVEGEMYENVVDINAGKMRKILVIILIAIITFPKPKSFKARIVNLATEKCQ